MDKAEILHLIIAQLSRDLAIQFNAAKSAHEAAVHEENVPDNEYDTLSLEASYLAQGQANRAQELRRAIEVYKKLPLLSFIENPAIRLTALVTLEAEDGTIKTFFIGPLEGGMKVNSQNAEIVVITPGSPLGQSLMGKSVGDIVEMERTARTIEFEIVAVC